jgi:hypothetical protein
VRDDCRHYLARTTSGGDVLQRCRLGAAEEHPFACPDGCLFFEERVLSTAGWAKGADQPMTSTAWGIAGLPPPPGTRAPGTKGKKRGRKQR